MSISFYIFLDKHICIFGILIWKHLKLPTKSAAVSTQVGVHNPAQQGGPKLGSGNGPFLYDGRTGYVLFLPGPAVVCFRTKIGSQNGTTF